MSQYNYYANPKIYFFPRSVNDLLDEEKKTVDGVETVEKKCGLKNILSTYEDDKDYAFGDRHFKNIESRMYLDLWNNYQGNEYTVAKKVCIGLLSKRDGRLCFMDKETRSYFLELACEISGNSQLTAYLKADGMDNSSSSDSSLVINMNPIENRIKELAIIVKYRDDTELPESAELKIRAKFCSAKEWKETFTLSLYRNSESSLDDFRQNPGKKDTDFFVLPRVAPSANQKNCIKQLQILNNQVLARNKKLTSFKFIRETGHFLKDDGMVDTASFDTLTNNISKSIDSFKSCRSDNEIGDFKTVYSYNFYNYGQNEAILKYININYSIAMDEIKGRVLDRTFLFGSCIAQNPHAKYEGIVNLYREVVVPFINDFTNQLNNFLYHNVAYLSCPAYNENYHRGSLTIINSMVKYLYDGKTTNIRLLSSIFNGYTGNNVLPENSIVQFFPGKDANCFSTTTEDFYKVNSISIPNYGTRTFTQEDGVFIKLSYNDKKLCNDAEYDCNKGNYTSSSGVTDSRDISAIKNYNNYGIPYYMFGVMQKWNTEHRQIYKKMTKSQLFSWNEIKNNWYSLK